MVTPMVKFSKYVINMIKFLGQVEKDNVNSFWNIYLIDLYDMYLHFCMSHYPHPFIFYSCFGILPWLP